MSYYLTEHTVTFWNWTRTSQLREVPLLPKEHLTCLGAFLVITTGLRVLLASSGPKSAELLSIFSNPHSGEASGPKCQQFQAGGALNQRTTTWRIHRELPHGPRALETQYKHRRNETALIIVSPSLACLCFPFHTSYGNLICLFIYIFIYYFRRVGARA